MFIDVHLDQFWGFRLQTSFFYWRPWLWCLRNGKLWNKAMPFHQLGKGREPPLGDAPLLGLSWFVMFSGDVEPMVKKLGWMLFVWNMCVYIYMFCMVTSGNLLYVTNLCRTMTISLRFQEQCQLRACSIKAHMCNHQIDICLTCRMPSPNVAVVILMCDVGHVQTLGACPRSPHRSSEWLLSYRLLYSLISVRQIIYWFTCAFACLILFAYMFIHVIWMYNVCIFNNIYIQYTYTLCIHVHYVYIYTYVCACECVHGRLSVHVRLGERWRQSCNFTCRRFWSLLRISNPLVNVYITMDNPPIYATVNGHFVMVKSTILNGKMDNTIFNGQSTYF